MKNKLEEIKKVLIIIDMVNGFVREGKMADPKIAKIIPKIEELIKEFIKENEGIIFVKDSHDLGCAEFKKFPEHCRKGTKESELVDELKVYEKEALKTYKKNSTSLMFAPNFIEDINKMTNLEEIIGVGCCSDICVLNAFIPLINYFDEHNKNIKITIPQNAIATYNSPIHNSEEYDEIATKLMQQSGIKLVKKYKKEGNKNERK